MTPAGGNKYLMIARKNFSLFAWVDLIGHTFDATEAFKKLLADLKIERILSEVVVVQSDDGDELNKGKLGKLCR